MEDNIIIENMDFTEELYMKVLEENIINVDTVHGIGDDKNGNN